MPQLNWEHIGGIERLPPDSTFRAKVPGGWLVYVFHENSTEHESYAHGGLTFYPDPGNKWDGGSKP